MPIHAWWTAFGQATTIDALAAGPARAFAEAVAAGMPAITLIEIKEDKATGYIGIHVEIDVERPQDLAYPIRAQEPIGILFAPRPIRPSVLALRDAFPHTMHQNGVPPGMPFSLCVDDRPWPEARLTYTPAELSRLIQRWLAKAARGELHDPAQPPDPLFYGSDMSLVLPRSVFEAGTAAAEFAGFMHAENPGLVIVRPLNQNPQGGVHLTVMAFALTPQTMTSIRHLPLTPPVIPAQVHLAFDRDLAASIAGTAAADRRKAVLIGAGSLGSQLGMDLAREGTYEWTVVDADALLPHNLARHALLASEIGAPKAAALARQIGLLLNEKQAAIIADVLAPDADQGKALDAAFGAASIIIDASASVGVARHLSDLPCAARRVCAFFNPSGTSVVLLAEDAARKITLRDLEAQYHRLVLTQPTLAEHLAASEGGVRYSGSCRSLTNKIPATRAAILSALAARGIADTLKGDAAQVTIWTLAPDGSVAVVHRDGEPVTRIAVGQWQVSYDRGFLAQLSALRDQRLPNETGGAIVGIADMSRNAIHLAHAFPEPEDSRSSPTRFERGVVGLAESIDDIARRSMHQVRYLGEWHSHPRYANAHPSDTDIAQLAYLGGELAADGLPGLMAIAAHQGDFSVLSFDPAQCQRQGRILKVAIRYARH